MLGDPPARRGPNEMAHPSVRIGVIADAHGYLDPRIPRIFAGVDHIVVAGDVIEAEIITTLREVAPVTAVRGVSDDEALAASLPEEATGQVGGVSFAVGHSSKALLNSLSAAETRAGTEASRPDLVIFGGTHAPSATWIDGTLFLNPGTASSPDREDNDPTVAVVERRVAGLAVRFVPLRRRRMKAPQMRRMMGFRWGFFPTEMEREAEAPRRRRGVK